MIAVSLRPNEVFSGVKCFDLDARMGGADKF
jgi:hypothetical protein